MQTDTHTHKDIQTERHMQTDRHTDRKADRQTHRQTERQIGRQTDSHMSKYQNSQPYLTLFAKLPASPCPLPLTVAALAGQEYDKLTCCKGGIL
uniref:Uncharacterized protein n=1 Tax=Hucho hucho TaxID=62062 RepID=A0A4W5KCN1_9TELE